MKSLACHHTLDFSKLLIFLLLVEKSTQIWKVPHSNFFLSKSVIFCMALLCKIIKTQTNSEKSHINTLCVTFQISQYFCNFSQNSHKKWKVTCRLKSHTLSDIFTMQFLLKIVKTHTNFEKSHVVKFLCDLIENL